MKRQEKDAKYLEKKYEKIRGEKTEKRRELLRQPAISWRAILVNRSCRQLSQFEKISHFGPIGVYFGLMGGGRSAPFKIALFCSKW